MRKISETKGITFAVFFTGGSQPNQGKERRWMIERRRLDSEIKTLFPK